MITSTRAKMKSNKEILYSGLLPSQEQVHSALFEDKKAICAHLAGARAGKTLNAILCMRRWFNQGANLGYWFEPTHAMIRQILFNKYIGDNEVSQRNPKKRYPWRDFLPGTYNHSSRTYTLNTGQQVLLFSAETPERCSGEHPDFIVANEAGQYTSPAWDIIKERHHTSPKSQILFSTTPYSRNWLYDVTQVEYDKYDMAVIHAESSENFHIYSPEHMARIRRESTDYQYKRKFQGMFALPEGLILTLGDDAYTNDTPPNIQSYIGGIDWGYSAPAAFVLIGLNNTNTGIVLDEVYRTELTTREFMQEIGNCLSRNGVNKNQVRISADSAEPDRIKEALQLGFNVFACKKDTGGSIARMQTFFSEGAKVKNTCEHWRREQSCWTYKKGTDLIDKRNPDHIMDATRYCLFDLWRVRQSVQAAETGGYSEINDSFYEGY